MSHAPKIWSGLVAGHVWFCGQVARLAARPSLPWPAGMPSRRVAADPVQWLPFCGLYPPRFIFSRTRHVVAPCLRHLQHVDHLLLLYSRASTRGFEPLASCSGDKCSIPLSYVDRSVFDAASLARAACHLLIVGYLVNLHLTVLYQDRSRLVFRSAI